MRVLLVLVALSCLVQAQASHIRAQAELWEVVYSRPRSPEAARALWKLAWLSPALRDKLLRRIIAEFPGSEEAFRARWAGLSTKNPQAWRAASERLQHEAGGPTLKEALARVEPWPVPAQRADFVKDVLRALVVSLLDEERQEEAREISRFLRVQYGSGPAGEAALYDLLERGADDREPPRIRSVGAQRLLIQLHDGTARESQGDLKTLRVRLDGKDITHQLVRRHYIDLTRSPDLPFERIELSYALALAAGPHEVEVEVRDRKGNPAASAWKVHTFVPIADERLRQAILTSDSAALQLLQAEPERIWRLDHNDFPPLVAAAWSGRTETVRWLLGQGVPLDGRALEQAASAGQRETARVLLEAGAPPTFSALRKAVEFGDVELTRLFLSKGVDPRCPRQEPYAPEELVFVAARARKTELLTVLMPYFPDRDLRDSRGCTLLAAVADQREPQIELIRLLLEARYDPNARDGAGRTVLQIAGGERCQEALKELLLRYGGTQ